jgi:hypothetical protein
MTAKIFELLLSNFPVVSCGVRVLTIPRQRDYYG